MQVCIKESLSDEMQMTCNKLFSRVCRDNSHVHSRWPPEPKQRKIRHPAEGRNLVTPQLSRLMVACEHQDRRPSTHGQHPAAPVWSLLQTLKRTNSHVISLFRERMILKLCFGNFKLEQCYEKDFSSFQHFQIKVWELNNFKNEMSNKSKVFLPLFDYFKCWLERNMEMDME